MKDQSLRLLMVDDSEDDTLLLIRGLKKVDTIQYLLLYDDVRCFSYALQSYSTTFNLPMRSA